MEHEDNSAPDDVVTSIRVPRPVHARIKALAAREQRSLGGEIRKLINDRLAEEEEAA